MSQVKDLKKRFHNLEIGFLGLYSIISDLIPEHKKPQVEQLVNGLYANSASVGGCQKGPFKGKG